MLIGRTLGHYHVTAALGAGGMGEVYRATDATLGRDVAIKVLPAAVASDPDRIARFRREARVLASLNHPHIASIYGFEEVDGTAFLTLELVEGEDLAERLRHGPVPTREALDLARQIAEALEAAHERGVIHRDLKPANIKVTPAGAVKVLDFGLAKAWSGDSSDGVSSGSPSLSPTFARNETAAGVILGTAAYMSPEQARGRVVDRRADIWAFGVVLYEMLTGRAPFAGETITDVIAAVVTVQPDLAALPPDTPQAVRRLLRRCLQKDPRVRLPDIGSVRVELSEILAGVTEPDGSASDSAAVTTSATSPRRRLAWVVIALAVAGALVAAFVAGRQMAPDAATPPPVRLSIQLPSDLRLDGTDSPTLSPDGRYLVVAAGGQNGMLWIRALNALAFEPLPGTDQGFLPFWSPDSRSIGFFAGGQLKRTSLTGGVQTLSTLDSGFSSGGAWRHDGTIVLSKGQKGQNNPAGATLVTVSASGGPVRALTTLDASRAESGHYWPQFLPDGRHVAFMVASPRPDSTGVFITALDAPGERQRLLAEPSFVTFAKGHLLFVRNNTLLTQLFDHERQRVHGEPRAIAEGVGIFTAAGRGLFSSSSEGVVAYSPTVAVDTQLTWVTRGGQALSSIGMPQPYGQIALSPDGKRAAVEVQDAVGQYDIWIVDLARGAPTRLTFARGNDRDPVWSPDATEIVFGSDRDGPRTLYRKALAGGRPETRLFESAESLYPESWTADGAILYQNAGDAQEGRTGWIWKLDGTSDPTAILKTGFSVDELQVSPDGRLLAYISAESGRYEVYVQPLDGSGAKVRVSTEGGGQPKWRRDGRELFFVSRGKLHVVEVGRDADLTVSLAQPLFDLLETAEDYDDYSPSADGQRFLVKRRIGDSSNALVHVVMHWDE